MKRKVELTSQALAWTLGSILMALSGQASAATASMHVRGLDFGCFGCDFDIVAGAFDESGWPAWDGTVYHYSSANTEEPGEFDSSTDSYDTGLFGGRTFARAETPSTVAEAEVNAIGGLTLRGDVSADVDNADVEANAFWGFRATVTSETGGNFFLSVEYDASAFFPAGPYPSNEGHVRAQVATSAWTLGGQSATASAGLPYVFEIPAGGVNWTAEDQVLEFFYAVEAGDEILVWLGVESNLNTYVPVPPALPLLGSALLGFGFIARRRKLAA